MRIGVPRESRDGETRVAATPANVKQLVTLGYDVTIESGAGEKSGAADEAYTEAGAEIGDPWSSEIVLKVEPPSTEEIDQLAENATLIGQLRPSLDEDLVEALAKRPITALAMDAVPRISRAQSLDVLSSMANIAGYRAVIEAAHHFGWFFTGQVTAAGSIPPAKVLIAGAGVAGLAAIGAASSLGAVVRATDPRPEVADQVRSLGGEFLGVETEEEAEQSTTGYASATSDDYNERAAALYAEQCAEVDVVITTALIPGKPAPTLLTAEHVASMKSGAVIVDMAAAQGGNVEGTVADEVVVTDNGVTIIGYTDLAGRLPAQASRLYGTNLVNFLKLATPERDGELTLDLEDQVVRGMTVVHRGENMWPPPQVSVSAPSSGEAEAPKKKEPDPPKEPMSAGKRYGLIGLGVAVLFALTVVSPPQLAVNLTVFVLAVVIGYYVIGSVHHALHTPLMSVTNAISGVIVVGALLQLGHPGVTITVIAAVAVLLASINLFGGFAVTRRMLSMFSRETPGGTR